MFGIKRPTNNEEDQPAETTCKKCGKKVLVSDLRMNPETRSVMCSACVRASSQNSESGTTKPFARPVSTLGQRPATSTMGQKPASSMGKPANAAAASALSAFAQNAGVTSSPAPSAPVSRPASTASSMSSSAPSMSSSRPSMSSSSYSSGSVFQKASAGPSSNDDGKTKKKCPRCNFVFTFDTVKQYPKFCPYCREKIV